MMPASRHEFGYSLAHLVPESGWRALEKVKKWCMQRLIFYEVYLLEYPSVFRFAEDSVT